MSLIPDWQKLLRRSAPTLGMAALGLGLVVLTAMTVGSLLARNKDWAEAFAERREAIGAPELLADLMAAGAARLDLTGMRIDLPPADCPDRLRIAATDPACQGRPDELERLGQRLYHTAAGRAIREEVAIWNQAFDVIAVRDDRGHGQACVANLEDGTARLAAFIVPHGCRPAQWSAYQVIATPGLAAPGLAAPEPAAPTPVAPTPAAPAVPTPTRIDVSHRVAADPAPAVFGFLAAGRRPELGDWLAIDAGLLGGQRIDLETRIARPRPPPPPPSVPAPRGRVQRPTTTAPVRPVPPVRLVIDVVGDVEAVSIDGVRHRVADIPDAPRTPGAGALPAIVKEQLCLDAGRLRRPRCTPQLLQAGGPRATRLDMAHTGAHTVRIEARPVRTIAGRLRQVRQATFCGIADPDAATQAPDGPRRGTLPAECTPRPPMREGLRMRVSEHLLLWCRGPAQGEIVRLGREAQCFLHYDVSGRTSRRAVPIVTIAAADGTPLATSVPDARNRRSSIEIRPAARELALLPVVGIGEADFLSLAGQIGAKAPGGATVSLRLTVEPDLQRIVREEVERRLVVPGSDRVAVAVGDPFADRRRGAILIMDADRSPGDILAVATWPVLGGGDKLAEWDLRALEAWNPADSPLAALAWSQNNFLTVPGSVFKPVTALAAIQRAVDGDAAVRQAILGYATEPALRQGMALSFADEAYQPDPPHPLTIRNFQGNNRQRTRVGDAFRPPGRTGCPVLGGGTPNGAQIGLCEALLKSNNVWFARLADMTDFAALAAVPRGTRATTTSMAEIVTRLYPGTRFPLVEVPGVRFSPGSRLDATPIVLDAVVAPVRNLNRRITLAFNGIGQQVQTTPTAIAALYAGIATGHVVRPRLIRGPPQPTGPLLLRNVADAGEQDRWLQYLRQGLKAVTSSPEGTASKAFERAPDLHPFLYAKTGTATVQDGDDQRTTLSGTLGHTVWFAGYFEPRAPAAVARGLRPPIARRIAFVCMVTHARGSTGGALCAPAIERVLRRMAALQPGRR